MHCRWDWTGPLGNHAGLHFHITKSVSKIIPNSCNSNAIKNIENGKELGPGQGLEVSEVRHTRVPNSGEEPEHVVGGIIPHTVNTGSFMILVSQQVPHMRTNITS
jgi:hypothetical protein